MIPKGSEKLRRITKEAFRKMTLKEKALYILEYYKLPLFTAIVVLLTLISTVAHAALKKETVLYLAYANVSVGSELDEALTSQYLTARDIDPGKFEFTVYRDLYIDEDPASEDHQYVYASKLKILGAITDRKMDIVLMNDNALKQFSASGLLMDLSFIEEQYGELYGVIGSCLRTNEVIIEDNSIEYDLNEADTYEAVTEEKVNAVEATNLPVFTNAGIDGNLYIGLIANTRHREEALRYIRYLFG